MDFLKTYQIYILNACGCVCILMAFFGMIINFHSVRKKWALIKLEIATGAMLLFDAQTYIYLRDASDIGILMARIANFAVFMLVLLNLYFLNAYVTAVFMETGKFRKLPRRLLLCFVLPCVGMSFVVISQFTGIYYYFDAENDYHRGSLYILGYLIPFITMLILCSFVIQYREVIRKRLFIAFVFCESLPFLAGVAQLFYYGLSILNMSTWVAALSLFLLSLSDLNMELSKAAHTELATGLPNTDGYLSEVDQRIHTQDITQFTAFYFDIVRMSHINNRFGKEAGDVIICKYAATIKKTLDDDEILGRLGGNFFVALVRKVHVDDFLKLLSDVPVEVEHNGKKETLHLAAVAGGYHINKKNINAGQVLSNAAAAVNYAKNVARKPYVFLDEKLEAEFHRIHTMEENTRTALEKGEFEPFYQPKIDTRTNQLCGSEALVRWRKGDELISPYHFIPVMEKNGSICDLDFYILEYVCRDIRGWLDRGFKPVQVSVNFSRRNLGNPILAEAISKVVEKYDISKDLVQIEVTETIDEYPTDYLIGVVNALRRYGLTTAIDDFGTGSSSIWLLKNVKFDVLKIDKTFIDYSDDKEKQLLRDIIQMAKHLGVDVIAEGVEQKELVEELKAMDCYAVQGYVFDKPMEKAEYEKRIANDTYIYR